MSKFNQKINEMLVVLNAVKKAKDKKDEKEDVGIDPITSVMNNALGDFGMSVEDPGEKDKVDDEDNGDDAIEGSIEKIEDLDLPRPDSEDSENGGDFNFLDVGGPKDVEKPEYGEDGRIPDESEGENAVKFEYDKDKGVVISIGDASATISPEQVGTIKEFLNSIGTEGFGSDDEGDGFGGSDDDEGDDDEGDDDDDDGPGGVDEGIDDPNPSTKRCPKCGGSMSYDKHAMQYKCPKCRHWERGASRLG